MLTAEQQRLRKDFAITASVVPYLMAGDETKIALEWMRAVEHPDYVPEDLSNSWPVQFGSYIEDFSISWHARKTGQLLTRRGEVIAHPEMPYLGCTLDCYRESDATVIDCKAPGRWRNLDDVLNFYPGQLVVQRACVKAKRAALLVVHGGDEPREHEVVWDDAYEREVFLRIEWFWACVESLQPPGPLPMAKAPVPAVRDVDMQNSNSWASFAANWLKNKPAAEVYAEAAKQLKQLVEPDVRRAYGHGVQAKRARNGAITLSETRQ